MEYRVILTSNGEYKKTFHRSMTRDTAFINFHKILEKNQVRFPKKFINTNAIVPVNYKICVTKPTEPSDTFRSLRDDFGRTYTEKPIGDWTILHSEPYDVEETFWIWGYDPKANRPTVDVVVKKIMAGLRDKNNTKQLIVVYNKLIIYNENQFDMVLCKCKLDAQRLHHSLAKIATAQKIKGLLFMGTASQATISKMYDLIHEKTRWPMKKIRRQNTRP